MAVEGASGFDVFLSCTIIGVAVALLCAAMIYSARKAKIRSMNRRIQAYQTPSKDREVLNVSAPRIRPNNGRERGQDGTRQDK
jgi:Flp pilus assembly protein TadB